MRSSSVDRIISKVQNQQRISNNNITTYSRNVISTDNSVQATALKFRDRRGLIQQNIRSTRNACTPVDSVMCVKNDTPNALRLNIASSVFDTEFETRPILFVNLIRNLDGTVDLSVVFESDGRYPQYPPNPTGGNFVRPFDLNSPFFGEIRYQQF